MAIRRVLHALALATLASTSSAELVTLTIEPAAFPDPSSVSVLVDAGVLGDDEENSPISGLLTVDLLPSAINPTSARITALEATIDDEVNYLLGGFFLLPEVTVSAAAGDLSVQMVEAGPAGEITGGTFDQLENLLGLAGTIESSIVDDPIDLGMEDPAMIDFIGVELNTDRMEVALIGDLTAQVAVPVDAGLVSLNVVVVVEGEIQATGIIPAAEYAWTVGAGEGAFQNAANWLRGDVAGTGSVPSSIDGLLLQSDTADGTTMGLGGLAQAVDAVRVAGTVAIADGTLQLTSITGEPDSTLSVSGDAILESNVAVLSADGGKLIVDGRVDSELNVTSASVSGAGSVLALSIGDAGVLELLTDAVFSVDDALQLELGSRIEVVGPVEPEGMATLAQFGSLDAAGLLSGDDGVTVNGQPLQPDDSSYRGHLADGVFGQIAFSDPSELVLMTSQAIAGDSDGSGEVDFADFLSLSAAFGGPGDWTNGDFNGDGVVEFPDFLELSRNFGNVKAANTQVVPEPSSMWLSIVAMFVCACFRRRRNARQMQR